MKNEKIKKILIIAGIIVAVVLLLDYVIMPFAVSSDEISVPNIVNKHKDDAVKILENSGLSPVLQDARFDPRVRKDFVILQRPEPGSIVKKGRRVYVAISGGDEKIKVPNLIGKSQKEAQILLENEGLKLGQVEFLDSEEADNTVLTQQYFPGYSIAKGASIAIKVSNGPSAGMVRVPKLIGKSLKDAETALEAAGLRLGNVEQRVTQSLLPNTVMEQSPSENALVGKEGAVNLVISVVKSR